MRDYRGQVKKTINAALSAPKPPYPIKIARFLEPAPEEHPDAQMGKATKRRYTTRGK